MSSQDDPNSDLDFSPTVRGLEIGQRMFGRYVLANILGRGGMGVVWRAFDEQLDRDVALKFLPETVSFDEQAVADLKRETKKSQELRHHHIVQVYDFVTDKRSACIAMEFVDGSTLAALKARHERGCLEVDDLTQWVGQLCDALSYAHGKARVVHRDLKPANLMVNGKSELKITDFGIARSVSDSMSLLTVGRGTSGTLVYMSPQQLDGERASPLDDIYSLGATLYEMLAGKPPFFSGNLDHQVRHKIAPTVAARRTDLEITGRDIPRAWEDTIAACLAKDPALRPQSAAEVAEKLGLPSSVPTRNSSVIINASLAGTSTDHSSSRRGSVSISRTRSMAVAGAVLFAATGIAAVIYISFRSASPPRVAAIPPYARQISSAEGNSVAPNSTTGSAVTSQVTSSNTPSEAIPTPRTPPSIFSSAPVAQLPLVVEPSVTPFQAIEPNGSGSSQSLPNERFPQTRSRFLSAEEVRGWSDSALRYAINELYARGGYDFRIPEVKATFSQFSWYRQRLIRGRSQDEAAAQLSRIEYVNLELLQKIRDGRR